MPSTPNSSPPRSRRAVTIQRKYNRHVSFYVPAIWISRLISGDGEHVVLACYPSLSDYLLIVPAAHLGCDGVPIKLMKSGDGRFTVRTGYVFVKTMFSREMDSKGRLLAEYIPTSMHMTRSGVNRKAIAIYWPGLTGYLERYEALRPHGQALSLFLPQWK